MVPSARIDDLRRRVLRDPASIAFAQLAEEYRRAGLLNEALDTCRSGLAIHPEYLSARVTLGRTLLELDQLDEAREELRRVLAAAPENLAATRALAETCRRQGRLSEALQHYTAALHLAPKDPDLERLVDDLGAPSALEAAAPTQPVVSPQPVASARPAPHTEPPRESGAAALAELEQWLEAIDAARANRHA